MDRQEQMAGGGVKLARACSIMAISNTAVIRRPKPPKILKFSARSCQGWATTLYCTILRPTHPSANNEEAVRDHAQGSLGMSHLCV